MQRKVLLVEFKYHQEIIPSQLMMLLDGGYDVHVFLDEDLWDEQLLGVFRENVSFTLLRDTKKLWQKISVILRIRRYIREHRITHLVINTLDSNFNYYVLKFNPQVHAVGIVHQVHRFVKKKSHRKSLAKVKSVATLSDYTFEYFEKNLATTVKTGFFYPIYFKTETHERRRNEEIMVVVPGQLDLRKRDYFQLIDVVEKQKDLLKIKFYLLGNKNRNNGPAIAAAIEAKGLSEYFFLSEGFLPYDEFFKCIAACDYVMPLLSNAIPNYSQYLQSQISASFNWGYAFQRKLLLHVDFAQVVKRDDAIFYDEQTLGAVLTTLRKDAAEVSLSPYFEFKTQQSNYLALFE